MPTSYPEFAQEVEDAVVEWAVDLTESIISALMPDGKPFGMEQKSEEQQIEEYLLIRDDQEAWANKIRGWVMSIIQTAQAIGVEEADLSSVHPYDIAQAFAFQWATRMEGLLQERMPTAPAMEFPIAPTVPSELVGVGAWQNSL